MYRPFQRFDPDNPEHVAWMEANKPTSSSKKETAFDIEKFNEVSLRRIE
jgi:hypothetical protein